MAALSFRSLNWTLMFSIWLRCSCRKPYVIYRDPRTDYVPGIQIIRTVIPDIFVYFSVYVCLSLGKHFMGYRLCCLKKALSLPPPYRQGSLNRLFFVLKPRHMGAIGIYHVFKSFMAKTFFRHGAESPSWWLSPHGLPFLWQPQVYTLSHL